MRAIKLYLTYFVVFFFPIQNLHALEQTTFFKSFSGICVNSIHDLNLIKNLSKLENWQTLPEDYKPMVAPLDYDNFDAWYFKKENTNIIIGISDFTQSGVTQNACTLATNKGNYEINEKLLIEFYEVKLIDELKQGIQTSKVFELKHAFFKEVYVQTLKDNRKSEDNNLASFGVVATVSK
ncbi:hypothetical protein N9W05_04565 [Alphaproteobacteria bacterium]|nr:hypothetical protein [Alphaproteobacteria bacterium]